MNPKSDYEQFLNRFHIDIISLLENFSGELELIMSRYDFLILKCLK